MHKFGIFSDPHIGLERRAHTTPASRKRLTKTLYDTALDVAENLDAEVKMCLGDLFDTSHNSEVTILQGFNVAKECDIVLGGNHDVPNREGTVCSFEIVNTAKSQNLGRSTMMVPDMGHSYYVKDHLEDTHIYSIPHQSSQELFDEALGFLLKEPEPEGQMEIVLLHCNYECNFADNEISLNLTSEMADKLLDRFDYVFIGHEHISRELKDGRLILVGNTHPTSFSDISDKFVWYITEDNEVIKEPIWLEEDGFHLFSFNSIPEVSELDKTEAQFIEVQGYLSPEEYAGVADFMVKLWEANPQALMIRNNLKVVESDGTEEQTLNEIDNLPAHISEELADDEDMKKLWESYVAKVGENP